MGIGVIFGLLGKKAERVGNDIESGLIAMLAKTDFDTLEAYQIEEYEKVLDQVSVQMAKAEKLWHKEQKDVEDLTKSISEKLEEANKTNKAMVAGSTNFELKGKLEVHLGKLIDEIEVEKARLIEEEAESKQASDDFEMYKEVVTSAAQRLASAKKNLGSKKAELARLEGQERRNKDREQQQKELMGIKDKVDSMGTMLGSLDKQIEKKRLEATASQIRVDALKSAQIDGDGSVDPEVAAIIGKSHSAPKLSVSDRLAALNQ